MVYITGETQNLAVIGDPVAHSLSPAMQNAAFRQARLDYVYIALPVTAENLPTAIAGLRAMNFRGFNVTIPHKTGIMEYLDAIDPMAAAIGAVNTVVNDGGELVGYNTDAYGFIHALKTAGFDPTEKKTVVLGAGGAAKAVVQSLLAAKAIRVTIGARNIDKARKFASSFSADEKIFPCEWQEENFFTAMEEADLLVNTTPLGMNPQVNDMPPVDLTKLKPGTWVYDIIYTPAQTRLLKIAAELGHPTLNGENMLVWQGAEAFRLWTGKTPNVELMKKVLREQLAV